MNEKFFFFDEQEKVVAQFNENKIFTNNSFLVFVVKQCFVLVFSILIFFSFAQQTTRNGKGRNLSEWNCAKWGGRKNDWTRHDNGKSNKVFCCCFAKCESRREVESIDWVFSSECFSTSALNADEWAESNGWMNSMDRWTDEKCGGSRILHETRQNGFHSILFTSTSIFYWKFLATSESKMKFVNVFRSYGKNLKRISELFSVFFSFDASNWCYRVKCVRD